MRCLRYLEWKKAFNWVMGVRFPSFASKATAGEQVSGIRDMNWMKGVSRNTAYILILFSIFIFGQMTGVSFAQEEAQAMIDLLMERWSLNPDMIDSHPLMINWELSGHRLPSSSVQPRGALSPTYARSSTSQFYWDIIFISQVLSFVSEYPSREYLSELVYPNNSIESISFIFITDCILDMRNRHFSERCDCGYV